MVYPEAEEKVVAVANLEPEDTVAVKVREGAVETAETAEMAAALEEALCLSRQVCPQATRPSSHRTLSCLKKRQPARRSTATTARKEAPRGGVMSLTTGFLNAPMQNRGCIG